jgi:hypothetical protein
LGKGTYPVVETWTSCLFQLIDSIKITVFRDVMPYSLVDYDQCFDKIYCLHLQDGRAVLKMEAAGSSEMLVMIYQTTGHHIPEDSNFLSHFSENLVS